MHNAAVRLFPAPQEHVGEIYGDLEFPHCGLDPATPFTAINMVCSVDGRAAIYGKAGSIGSSVDRRVMRTLRSKVDAVMVGAGTLRAEKISLSSEAPKEPIAVLVSSSGELPVGENLIGARRDRILAFIPETLDAGRAERISKHGRIVEFPSAPDGGLDLRWILERLKSSYGIKTLLLEGGPRLNFQMLSRNLVQEIFVTLSPKLLAGGGPSIIEGGTFTDPPPSLNLLSAHLAANELFLRYAVKA